jgi:hypothetical protein
LRLLFFGLPTQYNSLVSLAQTVLLTASLAATLKTVAISQNSLRPGEIQGFSYLYINYINGGAKANPEMVRSSDRTEERKGIVSRAHVRAELVISGALFFCSFLLGEQKK